MMTPRRRHNVTGPGVSGRIRSRERVLRERGPADPPCDRILIYDLEGELFFGAAPALETHLTAIDKRAGMPARVVVLRLKRVRNPDAVCLGLIDAFLRRLQARGLKVPALGGRLPSPGDQVPQRVTVHLARHPDHRNVLSPQ